MYFKKYLGYDIQWSAKRLPSEFFKFLLLEPMNIETVLIGRLHMCCSLQL